MNVCLSLNLYGQFVVPDLSVNEIAYFIRVQISKIGQFREIMEQIKEMIEHPTQIS